MLRIITGRAYEARRALIERVRGALNGPDEGGILVVVPAQYTLEAERMLLGESGVRGSFRLQVLSPQRLCQRVFDGAGWPEGARIDDQGRVMLLEAAAARHKKELMWYRGAAGRRGFAGRALVQISGFKQAGVTPEALTELAGAQDSPLREKLSDLALLYADYERAIEGRFLDGDDEMRRAAGRMAGAAFARGSEAFVYGFDLIPPGLSGVLLALCGVARAVEVIMCDPGARARDADIYEPVRASLGRLERMARGAGVAVERIFLAEVKRPGPAAIRHLEREVYALPIRPLNQKARGVKIAGMKNPLQEARFAAALIRELAAARNWRYREIACAVGRLDAAQMDEMRRAFALYEVPLFLPESRPASRHAVSVCLLSAIRLVTGNYAAEDLADYLRSGFSGLDDDQCDLLINHILRRGLRGGRLKRPIEARTGQEEQIEQLRARTMAPILELERAAREAHTVLELLGALFNLLSELDAAGTLERMRERLEALGQRAWAAEGAQVWKRILQAMDQMAALLGGERMTLEAVGDMLERALDSAEVKPLPQSGEAVLAGEIGHMKGHQVRALLILGLTDAGAPETGGLLSERELDALDPSGERLAFPDGDAMVRLRAMAFKAALSLPEEYLFISYPLSDSMGAAVARSPLIGQIRRALGALRECGGVTEDENMDALRFGARGALIQYLGESAKSLSGRAARAALARVEGGPEAIERARRARGETAVSERLPAALSKKLYGGLDFVSVSRLERFRLCPFSHFARYVLRPEPFEEFSISPRDVGEFYHEAIERFMRLGERAGALSLAASQSLMDDVTGQMLLAMSAMEDSPSRRAEGERMRRVARRAARTLMGQLEGGSFSPSALEAVFGGDELGLTLACGARLGGRIDRVDSWTGEGGKYLRVIDYKTGGKTLSLSEIYYGLQMQLMIYLAAALRQQGALPAGVFYFTISEGIVLTDLRDAGQVEALRRKKLRLDGLALNDPAVIRAMSERPGDIMQVSVTKDGRLYGERLIGAEDFKRLIEHTLKLADESVRRIRGGETRIAPVSAGRRTACDVCEFAALCRREAGLPGGEAAVMAHLKGAQVLKLLGEEREEL